MNSSYATQHHVYPANDDVTPPTGVQDSRIWFSTPDTTIAFILGFYIDAMVGNQAHNRGNGRLGGGPGISDRSQTTASRNALAKNLLASLESDPKTTSSSTLPSMTGPRRSMWYSSMGKVPRLHQKYVLTNPTLLFMYGLDMLSSDELPSTEACEEAETSWLLSVMACLWYIEGVMHSISERYAH